MTIKRWLNKATPAIKLIQTKSSIAMNTVLFEHLHRPVKKPAAQRLRWNSTFSLPTTMWSCHV
jgi:hypothetical protein